MFNEFFFSFLFFGFRLYDQVYPSSLSWYIPSSDIIILQVVYRRGNSCCLHTAQRESWSVSHCWDIQQQHVWLGFTSSSSSSTLDCFDGTPTPLPLASTWSPSIGFFYIQSAGAIILSTNHHHIRTSVCVISKNGNAPFLK